MNSKQDSVSLASDSFDTASPSPPPRPANAPKCSKSQGQEQPPITSQPQKATIEPVYQEPPVQVQKEEKKPARRPPAPPQKSINAAVDI